MQADGAVPSLTITFLGFGKVAVVLAQRLVGNGASVRAYDIVLRREGGIDLLRSKAGSLPISFVDVPEAISGAALIMSVVPPAQAMTVAIKVRPYLRPDQIFVDAASVGPREKRAIAQAIAPTGSGFVDAAILEAVETAGADVRILVCGPDASTANEILRSRGLNTEVLGADIGAASTFKMLRSVLSKGLEALLLEVMMAARTAGLDAPLWTEFERLFAERGFRAVGGHWILSHSTAYERRYSEILQVLETLRELGPEPLMTAATLRVFERSRQLDLRPSLGTTPLKPENVLDVLAERSADYAKSREAQH